MSKSKEVAMFGAPGGNLPSADTFRKVAQERMQGSAMFLRFRKGNWTFGPEDVAISDDEEWAIDPGSFKSGIVGWDDGNFVEEYMFPMGQSHDIPPADELPEIKSKDKQSGWSEQWSVEMQSMAEHEKVRYSTSTNGGVGFLKDLFLAIGEHAATAPDYPIPIVTLGKGGYKHKDKTVGRVITPAADIVRWVNYAGEEQVATSQRKLV